MSSVAPDVKPAAAMSEREPSLVVAAPFIRAAERRGSSVYPHVDRTVNAAPADEFRGLE